MKYLPPTSISYTFLNEKLWKSCISNNLNPIQILKVHLHASTSKVSCHNVDLHHIHLSINYLKFHFDSFFSLLFCSFPHKCAIFFSLICLSSKFTAAELFAVSGNFSPRDGLFRQQSQFLGYMTDFLFALLAIT